jgi:hypothetical protein
MPANILRLVWLFPIVFILHDFEELILFEPWLKHNASTIRVLAARRLPGFMARQIEVILAKTSPQFALPIALICLLTLISTLLWTELGLAGPFLLASSLYFLHGFMHIGQALLMRKYIPALLTSILVVVPYGLLLFWNLLAAQIITWPVLLVYFGAAACLAVPFILGMHVLGEALYKIIIKLAI